jgi:hypothetical protein
MINENIAYAKSILNKNGIKQDSKEYADYLRIREICGNNNGYVGILTKLRFIDNVSDMDEISSIFDVLKNSNIDINKLNKLSYDDILEMFYDDLSSEVDKSDIELIYKDDTYSYYRVYTYKGIMKIGSPSWCLKTKSNWDSYQSKYDQQWVVIENSYKKNLITPDNNNYLQSYSNVKKPWIRYGVSVKINDDGTITWLGNNDNNNPLKLSPGNGTSFGVLYTLFSLIRGNKKSYYDYFPYCEKLYSTNSGPVHKVKNNEIFLEEFMKISPDMFYKNSEIYVKFSIKYDFIPVLLIINKYDISIFFPSNNENNKPIPSRLGTLSGTLDSDYIRNSNDIYFDGIKLSRNQITIDDISAKKEFLSKFKKWIIFDKGDFYLIVNTDVDVEVPTHTNVQSCLDLENPLAFYIHKKTMKPVMVKINLNNIIKVVEKSYHTEVIEFLKKNYPIEITENPKEEKKVKGFFDFLKRKKS